MRYVAYVRVSRDDLERQNQIQILDSWKARMLNPDDFWELREEVESTRNTRPIKESILKDFRDGKIDAVIVTRIDRFARSLTELVMNVREIIDGHGRFIAIQNSFDWGDKNFNASQNLMLQVFGAFAEFEREIIRERTMEGLARARAAGRVGGRRRVKRAYTKSDTPSEEHGGFGLDNAQTDQSGVCLEVNDGDKA